MTIDSLSKSQIAYGWIKERISRHEYTPGYRLVLGTIAGELESRAGRRVSRGALYTTLDRLETKGLVRWKVNAGTRERGELPRRTYGVTARGVAALRAARKVLQRMWTGLDDLLKEPAR